MFGSHSHKWITDIMLDSSKFTHGLLAEDREYTIRRLDLIQKQLSRIEAKLFTEQENIDFLLGLVKDMVEDLRNW